MFRFRHNLKVGLRKNLKDLGSKKEIVWYVNDMNRVSNVAVSNLNASGIAANKLAIQIVDHVLSVGYENYEITN